MRQFVFLFLIIFGMSLTTEAQKRFVQGVVHTFDSIPLEGVQVEVKSTGQTYLTNEQGIFLVECEPKDKLKLKAEGFYGRSVKIDENLKFVAVNLKLKSGDEPVDYLVGYEKIKDSDNTGAVAGISYKDIDFTKYRDVQEIIQNNFAGVQVTDGQIVIRGTNTLIGDSSPLVVIDGVISNSGINSVHPLDVKWINILKDGTAAVYGSRGANGVILIETKKGGEL